MNNREARKQLIERYGAVCFIERLKLRDTFGLTYKGKGQYRKMKMLTYHHIKPKSKGGQPTVENGAILSNENHIWFNEQPKEEQDKMNRKFQEFKEYIDELRVEYVDDLDFGFRVAATEIKIDEKGKIIEEKTIDER